MKSFIYSTIPYVLLVWLNLTFGYYWGLHQAHQDCDRDKADWARMLRMDDQRVAALRNKLNRPVGAQVRVLGTGTGGPGTFRVEAVCPAGTTSFLPKADEDAYNKGEHNVATAINIFLKVECIPVTN